MRIEKLCSNGKYEVSLNESELMLYSDLHEKLYSGNPLAEIKKDYYDWYKDSDKKKVLPIVGGITALGATGGALLGTKQANSKIKKILEDKGEKSIYKTDPNLYKKYLDPKYQKSLRRSSAGLSALGIGALALGAGFLGTYAVDKHRNKNKTK